MHDPFPRQSQPSNEAEVARRRLGKRRVFGGAIGLALLLGSGLLAAALILRPGGLPAHASGGAPTPTPTVSTPVPGQPQPLGSLYLAAAGSLSRLNMRTGDVLWNMPDSSPMNPLVVGQMLFFNDYSAAVPALTAVNIRTGQQVWSSQSYPNGFLQGAGNMLYDSLCDFSSGSIACHLYDIDASTGVQRWSYDLQQGTTWITLHNGVLYGVSYTKYFALNAATGSLLWQQDLLRYTDQEATMAPAISGNVLSFASCNTTKQSSGYAGCYLYAFNAHTGQELWHMATTSSLQSAPAIMNGVIYAGAVDGTFYALKEQDGTQLWSTNAGGFVGQVLAQNGSIYVGVLSVDGSTFSIVAFDAATHATRWGQASTLGQSSAQPLSLVQSGAGRSLLPQAPRTPFSGGPAAHPFVLEHGLIYLQNGSASVSVLNAVNGYLAARFTAPDDAALYGFAVTAL